MEFKNYWGISEDFQDDLKYTDSIHRIMGEQSKYLLQNTSGKIFSVFGEIKTDGSMLAMARTMGNVFKGISGITELHETVLESSTKDLIDANAMYFDKRYGFEICTDKYRFRLFELRMTPIFPVEIIIDEGICKNIVNKLAKIAIPMEKFNYFKINDIETFCNLLQVVLQDRKVRYIIGELQKRVHDTTGKEDCLPKKVVICEGETDEIILQAIARKLNQKITVVIANGKYKVPVVFDAVKGKNTKSNILIVVDSNGDEEGTKKMFVEKIDADNYELAIINNCIEDWFIPEVADFSKLKLIQSIDTLVENADFSELSNTHESFATVLKFFNK